MNRYLAPIILTLAALVALTAGVQAAPSFRGYTGLVLIPTADTLDSGEWNVGIMTEDTGEFDANDIFANYGIADNLEVGFNSIRNISTNGGVRDSETLLNAKYRLFVETDARPSIAFGVTDITNGIDTTPYGVVSKSLFGPLGVFEGEVLNLRGHIGLAGGQFDGIFLGLSSVLGNRVLVGAEYDSDDVHFLIRFNPFTGFRIHGALIDVGGRSNIGLGISFNRFF